MSKKRTRSVTKVLFIGNSFTARNDVPGLVATIATAAGYRFDHRLISVGGASLRTHWNKGEAAQAIRSGCYDYVVLQEQSTLPIKNSARMHENVELFDQLIKENGSKTALYMTWARRHAPENQKLITQAYVNIAEELDATLIPVGVAWQRLLRRRDHPTLHDRDGSHPTVAGSFLAACVMYAVLFDARKIPAHDALLGLTAEEVDILRRAAVET